MEKSAAKRAVLKLPVQELDWKAIPENTKKIFFQFEVSGTGTKIFSLVAYPAYRNGKKWSIGKKIPLVNKKGAERIELSLPLTLGNLELNYTDLKNWPLTKGSKLVFTPQLYSKNPHAEYSVTDGVSQSRVTAKPSPPALPLD
jgi:hypothetical protein